MRHVRTQQILKHYFPSGGRGKHITFICLGDIHHWEDGRCTVDLVYVPEQRMAYSLELSKEEAQGFEQLGSDTTGHHVTLEYKAGGIFWTKGSLSRINKQNFKHFVR